MRCAEMRLDGKQMFLGSFLCTSTCYWYGFLRTRLSKTSIRSSFRNFSWNLAFCRLHRNCPKSIPRWSKPFPLIRKGHFWTEHCFIPTKNIHSCTKSHMWAASLSEASHMWDRVPVMAAVCGHIRNTAKTQLNPVSRTGKWLELLG